MKKPSYQEIEAAKATLEAAGYAMGTMWQIADVKSRYRCNNAKALEIMNEVLENDCTMYNTWEVMDIIAQDNHGLKKKKDA